MNDVADEPVEGSRISYVFSPDLADFFHANKLALFVTTYQAHRILLFHSPDGERMSMLMRKLDRPTGIALYRRGLAVASRNQIWIFRMANNLNDREGKKLPYDLVFLPRYSHVTGEIDSHQMHWHGDALYVVNTLYSCICTLDNVWSFVPVWKPPFITELVPEDRCHINGLCLDENGPKYVSALGSSNESSGWRSDKVKGGVLIDVPSGEIVMKDLAMPHSPSFYAGKFWLLESGTGSLLEIDPRTGKRTTVIQLPGFMRGLSFYDKYAFVGLCKAREKQLFGGMPVEQSFKELICAVAVINLETGKEFGRLQFTGGIEELFDIAILSGFSSPFLVGFEDEYLNRTKIFPKLGKLGVRKLV